MFKSNDDSMFVPTKTISIKPEAQIDYNPKNQNTIRWLIPQHIGFFDPRQTMMKYNLTMSGRGFARPSHRAGVHSLLRDLRVMDGTGMAELESIQDYNVLTAQWWGYTQNESIAHKRDMFEGRSANQNINEQLLYGASPSWGATNTSVRRVAKTVEIQQPIYSGVLGGDRVFPVVATQGLRVQMTLDNITRSLENPSNLGLKQGLNDLEIKLAKTVGDDVTAGDAPFTVVVDNPTSASNDRGVNNALTPTNNNPFDIGDVLYVALTDRSSETILGIITAFGQTAGDLTISYVPDRAAGVALTTTYPPQSRLYIKQADRTNGYTTTHVSALIAASAATQINYTISNLEMLLLQVQPPQQYITSMMNQVASSKGLSMDFRTWTLYRFNLSTKNGLTNQLIPANQQRAYSILSLPLDIALQNDIAADSFKGITDGCQNYQYVFGGSLIPDRPIDLVRYTQTPARTDALHIVELEKTLVNCGYGVRNLLRVPNRFVLGRAFSKYGQVMNLDSADLSLRVEYSAATEEKLFEHFVQFLRRVNISSNGVTVM